MDFKTAPVKDTNGQKPEPISGLIGDIGHHVAGLVDLQLQLLAEDARSAVARLAAPVIATVISLPLALAACVVMLLAAAELLVFYAGMIRGFAYLAVAVAGLVITIALIMTALARAKTAFSVFDRSRQELLNNLRALTSSLHRPPSSIDR